MAAAGSAEPSASAAADQLQGNRLDRFTAVAARGFRRPFKQRSKIPAGAARRPFFQCPAARQHDTDDGCGEELAHGQRPGDGQQRDDVNPDPAAAEAVCHRPQRIEGAAPAHGEPRRVRGTGPAGQVQEPACDQASHGDGEQSDRGMPGEPGTAKISHNVSFSWPGGPCSGSEVYAGEALRPGQGAAIQRPGPAQR
jgi:hypothetical protein